MLFNYATKEITMKVVYYGPGLCGKTTNLHYIHSKLNPKTRGKLISLATERDRTLFFDFLPMELGTIRDFKIRFQLYTVPGQVRYDATRKLVLKGADGVVFVADSQRAMMNENIESLHNFKDNLKLNGLDPNSIPLVLQFNKRDLSDISLVDELNERLNYRGVPFFEAIAIKGEGVLETFKEITRILLREIADRHKVAIKEKEGLLKEEVPVKEDGEALEMTAIEEAHSEVEVEEVVTGETATEILEGAEVEEAALDVAGYIPPEEKVIAPEIISPQPERIYLEIEKLSGLLKGIKGTLDPLLESLRGFKNVQEGLYKKMVENEETIKRRNEEILKSLNEIKETVEDLKKRPDRKRKWFMLR